MKWKDQSIKSRLLFVALAPGIVTSIALTLYFTLQLYNNVESTLQTRGAALARAFALTDQYRLSSGSGDGLNQLIQAVSRAPDVSALTIYDPQGTPLAAFGHALASPPPLGLANDWQGQSADGKVMSFHSKAYAALPLPDSPPAERTSLPARNHLLGSATIELSRDGLLSKKREILLVAFTMVVLIFLVAAAIAHRFGRDISESVLALEDSVEKIREGLFTSRVEQHPSGPLHRLEEAIDALAATLDQSRQRSKQALSASNALLQQQSTFANALLEAQSNAGMNMIIIEDGQILSGNEPALKLIGVTQENIHRLDDVRSIILAQDRPEFINLYQQMLDGKALSRLIEVGFRTYEGDLRWAEIVAFKIRGGNSQRIAIIGADITQRKHDAEQLLLAHQELQRQKDAAERASTAKSRFIAAASHDLRQPLHALSLFSAQLHAEVTAPAQIRLAGQIGAAIGNMSELLESLLHISKLDLVTLKPEIRAVEIGPLLTLAADTYRHDAESKKLRLVVVPTSLSVLSDARYLSSVITNLVSNAVRYTHRGGVLIGARREGRNVRIEIWDTGIGIDPEHTSLIFQEFYQVTNAERDPGKGLGLGLAIVQRASSILGHQIMVRSKPGGGSVFSVLARRGYPGHIKPDSTSLGKPDALIMLAINSTDLRHEFTSLIKGWGYTALPCEVDELAGTLDSYLPDLILCDERCAIAVSQTLRLLKADDIPILLLTEDIAALDMPPGRHEFTPLEIPVKPARLRALILHLLARDD